MRGYFSLLFAIGLLVPTTCMAQVRKSGTKTATAQKKTVTTQKKTATAVNKNKADISMSGHIDLLMLGNDSNIPIGKDVKANFIFEVYTDPTDKSAPSRKTAILVADVDWKALGADKDIDMNWSWSGKRVAAVKQDNEKAKGYAIMKGNTNVANVFTMKTDKGTKTIVSLSEHPDMSDLKQGLFVDDLARHIQKEIPGTRLVISGNTKDGLTEYVLYSFGENKVYDVTGDYHYELNNNEPYFTFWFDKDKKLVKWFKLK